MLRKTKLQSPVFQPEVSIALCVFLYLFSKRVVICGCAVTRANVIENAVYPKKTKT